MGVQARLHSFEKGHMSSRCRKLNNYSSVVKSMTYSLQCHYVIPALNYVSMYQEFNLDKIKENCVLSHVHTGTLTKFRQKNTSE